MNSVQSVEQHGKRIYGETFEELRRQLGADEHLVVCYRVRHSSAEGADIINSQQEWIELLAEDVRDILAYFATPKSYEPY